MANTIVSIIIPVHNKSEYLAETVDSVLAQDYSDFEVIFIDDASSDGSAEIIKTYLNDPKGAVLRGIFISPGENAGAAEARNIGLRAANGRYIAFLDADDLWDKNKLSAQISFMRENNYSFTFTDYEYMDKHGRRTGIVTRIPKSITYKQALKNTVIFTSTVMFDTEIIDKNDILMKNVPYEDTATWWYILKKYGPAYGVRENLVRYRRGGKTLSSNKFTAALRAWNLYRRVEGFGVFTGAYYFCFYAFNALLRRFPRF